MPDLPTIRRNVVSQGARVVSFSGAGRGTQALARGLANLGQGAGAASMQLQTRYLAEFENEQREKAAQLAAQNLYNPQGFQAAWEGRTEGALGEVPDLVKGGAAQAMKALGTRYYENIVGATTRREFSLGQDAWRKNGDHLKNDYMRHIISGTSDTEAGREAKARYDAHLSAGVGSKYISGDHADIARRQTASEGAAETFTRETDSLSDAEARDKIFTDPKYTELSKAQKEYYLSRRRARLREKRVERNQAISENRKEIRQKYFSRDSKFTPGNYDAAEMKADADKARALGDDETADRLDGIARNAESYNALAKLPEADLQQRIRDLTIEAQKDGAAGRKAQGELDIARAVQKHRVDALRADSFAYAARIHADENGTQAPARLDFTDTAAAFAAIRERVKIADKIGARLGLPVSALYADEAKAIPVMLAALPSAQKAEFMRGLRESMGPKHFARLMRSIAGSDAEKARDMTALGITAGERPGVGVMVAEGQNALAADKNYGPPNDAATREIYNQRFGGMFEHMPAQAREVYESQIKAVYAKLSQDAGDKSGKLNDDRMKEAMKIVMGERVTINGQVTIPVKPDMSQGDMDKLMSQVGDKDLGGKLPVAANGQTVDWKAIKRHGVFKPLGNGQYAVTINGQRLIDGDTRRPFVLDLGAVAGRVEQGGGDIWPHDDEYSEEDRRRRASSPEGRAIDRYHRSFRPGVRQRSDATQDGAGRAQDGQSASVEVEGAEAASAQATSAQAVEEQDAIARGDVSIDPRADGYTDLDGGGEGQIQAVPKPKPADLKKAGLVAPLSTMRVASNYGYRRHPIQGTRKLHTGIDFGMKAGSPIKSVKAGTVIDARWRGGYGYMVSVRHPDGVVTRYAHMATVPPVKRGDKVSAGAVIGKVGSTGRSTGAHLHLETLVGGKPKDPRTVYPALFGGK